MPREIDITALHLHANATPCFHHCRYCQLKTSKSIPASFSRYAALIERFLDWQKAGKGQTLEICPWYGNSHDYDRETRVGLRRLGERQWGPRPDVVLLGGVAHRSQAEMRLWLQERRDVAIETVVATFAGHAEHHDYWNNKAGNYRFFQETLRTAAAMGLRLQERVLLIRRSLASLERLFDDLDAIGAASFTRWSLPLFYSGRAKRLEDERLTERDFAALPPRIRASLREDHVHWRSERRWMETVRQSDGQAPERMALSFPISEKSLDWAEKLSCDEIVAQLAARWRAAYRAAPSRQDLCERYGDARSDKVYPRLEQMEKVWMDRFLTENPCTFDIDATHFQ